MSKASYHEYLRSAEWAQKRSFVIGLYGAVCTSCGSTNHIQVHHKSYKNLHSEAEIDDLIVLCRDCHEVEHEADGYRKFNRNRRREMQSRNKKGGMVHISVVVAQVLADYKERASLRKQIDAGGATEKQFDELCRIQGLQPASFESARDTYHMETF